MAAPFKARVKRWIATFPFGLLLCVIAGCSDARPGLVPVSGTVSIDGKPLPLGQIRVLAEGRRASIGNINEDGSFVLSSFRLGDGAYTGTHLVTVCAIEEISERATRWHAPQEYSSKIGSGLWVTIDGPTDDLKVELTWADSKKTGPYVERQ